MPAGRRVRLRRQAREHRTAPVPCPHVVAAVRSEGAMNSTDPLPIPHSHEAANILLVDDQPARLLTYRAILEPLGHNLVAVNSGLEALEALMKQDFAVVLLDVKMPGMDGFETAALIHDHPRFETIPIIFVPGVQVTEFDPLKR